MVCAVVGAVDAVGAPCDTNVAVEVLSLACVCRLNAGEHVIPALGLKSRLRHRLRTEATQHIDQTIFRFELESEDFDGVYWSNTVVVNANASFSDRNNEEKKSRVGITIEPYNPINGKGKVPDYYKRYIDASLLSKTCMGLKSKLAFKKGDRVLSGDTAIYISLYAFCKKRLSQAYIEAFFSKRLKKLNVLHDALKYMLNHMMIDREYVETGNRRGWFFWLCSCNVHPSIDGVYIVKVALMAPAHQLMCYACVGPRLNPSDTVGVHNVMFDHDSNGLVHLKATADIKPDDDVLLGSYVSGRYENYAERFFADLQRL